MVSIGGDRATSSDYKRANKEAVRRSQKSSKPRAEKREPERKQKTLGPRLWNPTPARGAPARQSSSARPAPAPAPKPKQPGFNLIDFLSKKENWTRDVGESRQQEAAKTGKPARTFGEFISGSPAGAPQPKSMEGWVPPPAPAPPAGPTSQPGRAPAAPNPAPAAPKAPPPQISDGVRELLNDANWKVPEKGKTTEMPKSSFEKGGVKELLDYDYSVTEQEWNRIVDAYSTPEARAAGFIPPSPTKTVDDNTPLMNLEPEESAALTWEAYEALSNDQKAAIDFNTLLVDARQKDLKKPTKLTGNDLTDYTKKVTELFGEGRGADVVATNTVGLLDQLDMDVVGQDLDEYLSLERAIDTEEIGDFEFSKRDVQTLQSLATGGEQPAEQIEQQYATVRSPENLAAVDTSAIQKAQQLIKTALQSPEAMTYDFDTLVYGPSEEMKGQPPMGFGDATTKWKDPTDADKNEWFQSGLTILGSEDPSKMGVPAGQDPMSWLLGDLDAATQGDAKTRQEFIDYIANTTNLVGQYGTKEDATLAAMINKRAGLGG